MKVLIRTTANGNEYWDSEAKKVLFVPAGMRPSFEVTENPKSMIVGIGLANGKDATVINSKVVESPLNLDGMNATQLREFAEENSIEVPGNLKKPETIRDHIEKQLVADGE